MSIVFAKQFDPKALGSGGSQIESASPNDTPPDPRYFSGVKSKTGHQIRLDDTPNGERILIFHRSGSYMQFDPDGTIFLVSQKEKREDTNGPQIVRASGNYDLIVEGGKCAISSTGGEITLVADTAIAITARGGPLKLKGKTVEIDAEDAVRVSGQSVDIIASGSGITLPTGIIPVMGTGLAVRYMAASPGLAALSPPANLAGLSDATKEFPAGSPPLSISPVALAKSLTGIVSAVTSIAQQINTMTQAASNMAIAANIAKGMLDAKGKKVIPEIDQPEELPLTSPLTYMGVTLDKVQLRDRLFDTEEDVGDAQTYTAHLNLAEKLDDFTGNEKDLPGETFESDDTQPEPEPKPSTAFALESGTVTCTTDSKVVEGSGTKFTEEVAVGQTLNINNADAVIAAIESDTRLILAEAWSAPSVTGQTAKVYRFRSFQEFYKKYDYAKSAQLGDSGLTLGDMFANYVPGVVEREVPPTSLTPGVSGTAGGPVGPEPNTGDYIIPVTKAEQIMKQVFDTQGWNIGITSTRDERNNYWEAAVAVLHYGHSRYNSTPDSKWCIKDAGSGRPQSDDVIARSDTRDAWDLVGSMGGDSPSWGRGYIGKLGSEQNIYAPSRDALNRIR